MSFIVARVPPRGVRLTGAVVFVHVLLAGTHAFALTNPPLDRISDFAAESGLVVILHNDIDIAFSKQNTEPVYRAQVKALLKPYLAVFDLWAPVWRLLTPDASLAVRQGNYQRLFDEGRRKVRAWEATNAR